jgi:hypothetical protein
VLKSLPDAGPLILLIDEADWAIDKDRPKEWELFNLLRDLSLRNRAHFVLSGGHALSAAIHDPSAPLYNLAANVIRLGPLEFRSVEELVTRPMRQLDIQLSDEQAIVKQVWEFTSGHPNVVQRLCLRLVELLNRQGRRNIRPGDVQEVIATPEFIREDFLETYFDQATVLEHICALLMASDDRLRTLTAVQGALLARGVRADLKDINAAMERLKELRGILRETSSGYEFAVQAFPRVIRQSGRLDDWLALRCEIYGQTGDIDPKSAPPEIGGRLW